MLHIAASAMTPADISWDFIIGGLARVFDSLFIANSF